jgi:hypothetical protein
MPKEQRRDRVVLLALWGAFAITIAARLWRTRDFREPYAEDGSALILGALSSPWNLLAPVVDGLLILPRLIAAIATSINLALTPAVLSFFSVATLSLVAAYCLRGSLVAIAPTCFHRLLLGLVIAVGSGSLEIAGFATGTSYIFTLFLVLLALEAPRLKTYKLATLVLLLSFSSYSSFVSTPLFLFRGLFNRDRTLIAFGILTAAPLPIIFTLAMNSPVPYSLGSTYGTGSSLSGIFNSALFYLFVAPIGGGLLGKVSDTIRLPLLIVSIIGYFLLLFQSDTRARIVSVSLFAGSLLFIIAHSIGRAYPLTGSIDHFDLVADRYAFLLIPCALMAWSVVLFGQQKISRTFQNLLFSGFIGAQCATSAINQLYYPPEPSVKSWRQFAAELEEALRASSLNPITDLRIAPFNRDGESWGLIHCDTSNSREILCYDQRGNKDAIVYSIARRSNPKQGPV